MAKYIIDVSDEAIELMGGHINIFVEPVFKTGDCKRYALRLSKEDIEPYTEPDRKAVDLQYARDIENVARMNYNEGAKDAWDFAKAINYMGYDDFVSCFGGKTEEVVYELSYSEVKAKYDAWKIGRSRGGRITFEEYISELKKVIREALDVIQDGFLKIKEEVDDMEEGEEE